MHGVTASAPGKLVLAGEYAVLAGAPALVAAIDRRVTCRMTTRHSGHWQLVSRGFEARCRCRRDALGDAVAGAAALVGHAGRALGLDWRQLPEHLHVEIDSRPCYQDGAKLGLGSSAAALVAVAAALAALVGRDCELQPLIAAHRAMQGGAGSGLDVAAAWHGGVIRFQNGRVEPARLPDNLHTAFAHAGWSTRTPGLVAHFESWRRDGEPPALKRLMERAAGVFDAGDAMLARLAAYTDALQTLDEAANIGIFSPPHLRGRALAARHGILYKPCGAGGGDMGIAMSDDASALAAWCREASEARLSIIDAAFAGKGVRVEPLEA